MTHVHYKFSSKLSYDTVVFDGPHITLKDLKRQIMGREKLRAGDCDLQITNAQTKEEYTDEEGLIPKGSSVIVRRIPNSGVKSGSNSKTRNTERSDVHLPHPFGAIKAMDDQSSSRASPLFSKMANLADVDASEEDKIQVMLNQSIYDSMNYNKKFGAALPSNYTCYRCGNTGHHIRNCPTSGLKSEHQDKNVEAPLRLKKSTGIPRSFMVEVDDPNIKGAMLTNSGRYAIPALHAKAYAIGKKEKPPFLSQEQLTPEDEEDPVPNELRCLICHDLLSDAVVIPCCGNSYCDDCVRTALLDSDDHICPTCGQSDVSPDTLIPNKFLRQAVNTFKKEQGQTKSLRGRPSAPQSQNPTPTPSPVPTPPPINMQIQPQKPQKSTHSQQDPLLQQSQTAGTSSSSQACGAPPTAMSAAPDFNTPSTSLQPLQSHPEISDKEAEERTQDDSVPASPSILVSSEDPTAAAPQPIPLVDHTPEVEQRQTVSVNLQQSSSAEPAPVHPGPSQCWKGSSSSSSVCPTRAWSESNSQQPSPSTSSYPTAPPPLFPSPLFHTFLAAQQPLNSYPPGYPPATPVWTLPAPQGAPVPSLCSSASTSSIPALIPKDWYMHQRRKKERSPHRGSTYSRSPSRSHSKSSKSKSSRSYSHSSSRSRSRSRSRSQGRSRPHSPYSRHRDLHTRPHSSHSYSYGYKRSPTPSSSSSPRGSYRSRSKSPSDHRKSSHHSRHHNKKSSSCRYSSRKRGEHSQREAGGTGYLHAQGSSLELDRERYQQWKKAYKDWCEKYFNSYVGHFHQLPPPLLSLPPSPPPQWGGQEGNRNHSHAKSESRNRHAARMDDHSPPSQSSSDSRSPPSQSSSDSRSTPSQSSSDSRSSLSHSPTDSGSPPSQSSTDRRSTSSEDVAQPRTLRKGSKEADLQVKYKDDKLENHGTLKHEQKSKKKHKRERGEVSSSPEPSASIQDKVTARKASEAVKTLVKPDKHLDKERKGREERNLDKEEGGRQGKLSHSKRDIEKQPKEKPNNRSGRVDTDRFKSPEGSKASDSRSERTLKRKGEDVERSSAKAQSSKYLKIKIPEVPQTQRSEPLNPEPKMEKEKQRKTWPLTKQDIWEGEIKVKPQKKISININLETKRKEENMGKQDLSCLESIAGKPNEEIEKTAEEINRAGTETEANDNKESNRNKDGLSEGKMIPEKIEMKPIWEKDTSRHDEREMEKKHMGERKEGRQEEDFDLWHCALRGVEEEQETSKKPLEEPDRMEASKEQEVTNEERTITMGGKEEERRVRNDGGGQEMAELITNTQMETEEGESTLNEKRGNPLGDCTPKEELMDGVKWRMRTEEQDESMMRSKSQRSRNESHHDGPNTAGDDGSTHEVHQERKMELKTLEEYTQDGAAGRQEELITQVPRSKWEKEESEREEQDEPGSKVKKDALTAFLPSSSSSSSASSFASVPAETPTERETEGEYEQQSLKEKKRDKAREMERGKERDKEKHRSVAPSSGRDRPDNASSTERDRERRRESEKLRQKESKTTERIREEEKRRDRAREKGHGSRNPHSSSRSHSYSTSRERERQRGDDRSSSKSSWCAGGKSSSGRSSSISRAGQVPDENAQKTSRGTFLDLKSKDKHYFHNPQDPPGNYRLQDRSAGTHHSPSSHRESWGKQLPSESSSQDLAQSRNRVEKLEKEEWKQNKVEKVIKEAKWERDNEVAEREGSFQWEDEADKLEEGERPSSNSVSSLTSQESSSGDDGGKEQEKKHKREKRQAIPELQEEEELKKHKQKKKSKKSRDSGEEWSSGEVDNKWEEEEDRAELYSVMLF